MTQGARNFVLNCGRGKVALTNNAIECGPPVVLWLSDGGASSGPRRPAYDGEERMNSRFVAGIMVSATLGCGLMAAGCVAAQAQFFRDPDRYGGPAGQMFRFASSPGARTPVDFFGPPP